MSTSIRELLEKHEGLLDLFDKRPYKEKLDDAFKNLTVNGSFRELLLNHLNYIVSSSLEDMLDSGAISESLYDDLNEQDDRRVDSSYYRFRKSDPRLDINPDGKSATFLLGTPLQFPSNMYISTFIRYFKRRINKPGRVSFHDKIDPGLFPLRDKIAPFKESLWINEDSITYNSGNTKDSLGHIIPKSSLISISFKFIVRPPKYVR